VWLYVKRSMAMTAAAMVVVAATDLLLLLVVARHGLGQVLC
jgi:hypothetical protein